MFLGEAIILLEIKRLKGAQLLEALALLANIRVGLKCFSRKNAVTDKLEALALLENVRVGLKCFSRKNASLSVKKMYYLTLGSIIMQHFFFITDTPHK